MGVMDIAVGLIKSTIGKKNNETEDEELNGIEKAKKNLKQAMDAADTPEQKKAIFYFSELNVEPEEPKTPEGCLKGCLPKKAEKTEKEDAPRAKGCKPEEPKEEPWTPPKYMPDAEYDKIVQNILARENSKVRILEKLGLDESQVNEIEPIHFSNYDFPEGCYVKVGKDYRIRSSTVQDTWIFFGKHGIYACQCLLNTNNWEREDAAWEFAYSDICSIHSSTKLEIHYELVMEDNTMKEEERKIKKNNIFLKVANDELRIALSSGKQSAEDDASIAAMKQLIREKKSK